MKDLGLTLEEIHEDFEEEPVLRREKKDERGLKEEHRTFSNSSFPRQTSFSSMRRASMVSMTSMGGVSFGGAGGAPFQRQFSVQTHIRKLCLVAPESSLTPWLLTILAVIVILTQASLLGLYWAGIPFSHFKSDLLCQALWGGLLALISGISALIARNKDSSMINDFPLLIMCHITFAALAAMMCLLVVPVMFFRELHYYDSPKNSITADTSESRKTALTPFYLNDHFAFACSIFNITAVSLMAIVAMMAAVTQILRSCCKKRLSQKGRLNHL
ncbi:Oidioi.mRNA.OKI2018_I69.chr1.g2142.t1.cds [Oikopleura dioica]|uniref:Oidioi.mRNA.OKI2018_I69.chr1.g2142.t1.cds n=1 Tax=Oikopleura dioica TaxID=34765 RepID=A0ABN7STQ7_OIKDI|nr:Oidioi.mRNA.OKI2018_I69.chr1.g2142.t1.cds [Oikopleura dioica]